MLVSLITLMFLGAATFGGMFYYGFHNLGNPRSLAFLFLTGAVCGPLISEIAYIVLCNHSGDLAIRELKMAFAFVPFASCVAGLACGVYVALKRNSK